MNNKPPPAPRSHVVTLFGGMAVVATGLAAWWYGLLRQQARKDERGAFSTWEHRILQAQAYVTAKFVRGIGDLVNDCFGPVMAGQSLSGRSVSDALARAEAIWARVVELEVEFRPNEGGGDTFRACK